MELGVGGQRHQKRCKQIKTKKNFLIYLGFPPLLHTLLPPPSLLPKAKKKKGKDSFCRTGRRKEYLTLITL